MKILLLFMIILFSGCKDGQVINFNPDFFLPDLSERRIVNEQGLSVDFDDPKIEDYACLHYTKVQELAAILERARLPKDLPVKKNISWVLTN